MSDRPTLTSFAVEQYRAFGGREHVHLAKITLVLGRNNAGKSALCFAPVYLAEVLRCGPVPLPNTAGGIDFGPLVSAIYCRNPTGLRFRLDLEDAGVEAVDIGITASSKPEGRLPIVTHLQILPGEPVPDTLRTPWAELVTHLSRHPGLARLPDEICALKGIRRPPPRLLVERDYEPEVVDAFGDQAPYILRAQRAAGLERVNEWFQQYLVQLSIEPRGDHFEVLASGTSSQPVNLVDSGAGIAQVLPLVVQARLAKRMPRLWCIEQPELHLHPRAHAGVGELLVEVARQHPETRLLVETHSDTLVLSLRRAVAEGRLGHEDLRIYFVDESKPGGGSSVREIELDSNAAPTWWPDGVFAESQREYAAIRRALREREG